MSLNSNLIQSSLKSLQKQPQQLWLLSAVWLTLIIGIAVWLHLGSTGLVDETEPLFAEAARQMTLTGNWITPYFDGATRFDKPPLIYWLMTIAYQTIGVNEWAVRLPSALAATLLTLFGFYTLCHFGFPRPTSTKATKASDRTDASLPNPLTLSAWVGAALIVLNLQTMIWARAGVSDMLLSGCMGSALLAFFWGYAQPDRPRAQARWYLAFYGLSALAVLTKGPVGIVLPVLIIAAFLLYVGNLPQVLREMQVVRGCLLFLAIALPWYVLVIWANGEDYIRAFFGYHNLERFTRVVNNHWAPIWYYLAVVPLAFLPWSAYLPIAIARLRFWHVDHWRQQPRFTHLGLFALVWLVIIFGFFTIAVTKLPSYMLPLMPAAAILVGLFWSDQMTHPPSKQAGSRAIRRSVWLSHLLNISLALTLAAVVFYSPNWLGNDPEFPHLAEVVRQSGITLIGGSIWILVAAIELVLLLRRQSYWIWAVQLVGFIAFVLLSLLPLVAMVDMQRQLPLRQLAATIEQVQHPEEPIIMVGYGKPSLVFYSHRSVTFISQPSDALDTLKRLSHHPGAANSLLLLGRPSKLKEAGIYPDQYKILSETEVYRLARMTLSAKPE